MQTSKYYLNCFPVSWFYDPISSSLPDLGRIAISHCKEILSSFQCDKASIRSQMAYEILKLKPVTNPGLNIDCSAYQASVVHSHSLTSCFELQLYGRGKEKDIHIWRERKSYLILSSDISFEKNWTFILNSVFVFLLTGMNSIQPLLKLSSKTVQECWTVFCLFVCFPTV